MSFDLERIVAQLPDRTVVPVHDVDIRLSDEPHPFEAANAEAIAANWEREVTANPRLFNGRMVLPNVVRLEEGILAGTSHEIDFATFLYWRRQAERGSGFHLFGYAILVAADGALVAGRMGNHTANAGKVYFAAGSFEPGDFVDGRMSFRANTFREVREETGLDLAVAREEGSFGLLRAGRSVLLFRRYFLPDDADTIARSIAAHIAADPDPEIVEPVIIRDAAMNEPTVAHMPPLLQWHFSGGRLGRPGP